MSIEDIKNYFHNYPVYIFSGPKEELQSIVGTNFSMLIVEDKVYFSILSKDPLAYFDERMELI